MIIPRSHWSTLQSVGGGKIQYHLNIVLKRGPTGGRDAVAKEVKFGNDVKHALLQVDVQPFVSEDGQRYLFLCGATLFSDLVVAGPSCSSVMKSRL